MNIHEYQAKEILRKYGVTVLGGHVCYNSASVRDYAKRIGEWPWESVDPRTPRGKGGEAGASGCRKHLPINIHVKRCL